MAVTLTSRRSMLGNLRRALPEGIATHLPKKKKSWIGGAIFDLFIREFRIGDLRFAIPRHLTQRSFRSRFLFRTYEEYEIKLVRKLVKPGMSVLELGACIGVVSCVTSRRLAKGDVHVVVEANPALIPALTENRDRNHCGFAIESGLVSRTSDGSFYVSDLIVGGSADLTQGRPVTVPVVTIDDLERKYATKFDVLIMDIECGEVDFCRENPEMLAALKLAIIEIHDMQLSRDAAADVRARLAAAGLRHTMGGGLTEVWER